MPELEDFLSAVESIRRRIADRSPSNSDIEQLSTLLMPLVEERAFERLRNRPGSLAATLAASRARETPERSDDAGDVATRVWLYWLGDDFDRICRLATDTNDTQHFVNRFLKKVDGEVIDFHRRRARHGALQRNLQREYREEWEPENAPDDSRRDVEVMINVLAEMGCSGGQLLCLRYRHVSAAPAQLTDPERSFLRTRGIDPESFLSRAWEKLPPPVEQLADALGYSDRNAVDQHVRRANQFVGERAPDVRRRLESSR